MLEVILETLDCFGWVLGLTSNIRPTWK